VTRLGCRAEYHFLPEPPRDGAAQWAASDPELERFLHLYVMNRRVLMTPFHNMALMSPARPRPTSTPTRSPSPAPWTSCSARSRRISRPTITAHAQLARRHVD
jgi:hypothetical protein